MNNINRYYEILGLKPGTSLEEVKQAYRDLAMVWHPDRFPSNPRLKEKAQEELKKINEAYEVLKSYQPSSQTQASPAKTKPPSSADCKIYYEQAMEKAKRGRYKEAIEDFSHALRISHDYAEAYNYRGLAHSKLEDNQRAIEDFKKAADLYLKQGKTNDYQDVIECIKKLQIPEPVTTIETNYRKLHELLSAGKWKEADQETLAVMLKVAGREKEGWLREEDIKNFPCKDLCTIDTLWVKYSSGRFGFSVQKHIWHMVGGISKADRKTWCSFGDRIGWRVKDGWFSRQWLPYDNLTFTSNAPAGHFPAALPGSYSPCLVVGLLVFVLAIAVIFVFCDGHWWKSFYGLMGLSAVIEMCNGNQRYTTNWWKRFFSHIQACGL